MKQARFEAFIRIPVERQGDRLDRILADEWSHLSRSQISAWIADSQILVDGAQVKASYRVRGDEYVVANAKRKRSHDPCWDSKQDVEFKIVYEDEHVIVVDKPAGIVVHPGTGNASNTLVNGLIAHRESLNQLPRAGIVHRLDKDTSGLLVIAASSESQNVLTRMISERDVVRKYLCVVDGLMDQPINVDLPMGRHRTNRVKQQVREDGKPARTEFYPLELFRGHSLVQAILHTGRTHQIRVHAQEIEHPLVGDVTYGATGRLPKTPTEELKTAIKSFSRQSLHAKWLEFKHPITGKRLRFTSKTPPDMDRLISALRFDAEQFITG